MRRRFPASPANPRDTPGPSWLTGGLDLGIAESAVIAGLQAARALSGEPLQICGERDGVDVDPPVDPAASASTLRMAVST